MPLVVTRLFSRYGLLVVILIVTAGLLRQLGDIAVAPPLRIILEEGEEIAHRISPSSAADNDTPLPEAEPVQTFNETTLVHWTYSPFNFFEGPADFLAWIYNPIHHTIREAFEAYGLAIRRGGLENTCEALQSVKNSIARGIGTPIVVLVAWHWRLRSQGLDLKSDECHYERSVEEMAKAGAYIVFYATEPSKMAITDLLKAARHVKAHEVWSYSKYMVDHLMGDQKDHKGMALRFLPPGCAKALNLNVNLRAKLRTEDKVGFIGRFRNLGGYRAKIARDWRALLRPNDSAYDARQVKEYLEILPLQLNLHGNVNRMARKDGGADGQIFEYFRASLLLTNSACVFSETPSEIDMAPMRGIVEFADLADMRAKVTPLLNNSQQLRECQERSRRLYCEKFRPHRLLEQSGFTASSVFTAAQKA